MERGKWQLGHSDAIHCWVKDQLVIYHSDTFNIYLEGNSTQSLTGVKGVTYIESTISGFIALTSTQLQFYKVSNNMFEVRSEYELAIQPSSKVILSPQEDMVAFYSKRHEAIYYSHNFENQ